MSKHSRKKKQAIRNIENHLKNYRAYKVGISNLKRKLDMILPSITTDYEIKEGSSGVFVVKSKVEDVVICRLDSVEAIKANQTIQLYEMIVETIDRAVAQLEKEERNFVKLRYFDNMPVDEICIQLCCSERHVFNVRYHVLNQFLISLANIKDVKM